MALTTIRLTNSINSKLAVPLLIIFCLVTALFMLSVEYRTRNVAEQQLNARAIELAETFAVATEINTSNANFVRVVNSIGAYEDVTALFLIDDKLQYVVASAHNRYTAKAIAQFADVQLKQQLIAAANQLRNSFSDSDGSGLWYTYKLQSITEDRRNLRRMTLLMAVDVSSSEAYVRSVNLYFFTALIALLTTIALTFFIVVKRHILTPVASLMQSIQQTQKHNKPIVSQYQSNDEMGVLSKVYNELIVDSFKKQQALKIEREKSESALQAKSRFLAMMTHELRTPLNGVIGMSNQLDKLVEGEKQRKYLSVIQTSANQLLAIINDTLDFSKIEADKLELDIQPMDLVATLNNVISMFEPGFEQSKVTLQVTMPEKPLPKLMGDNVRISQVVINLLGNAIKFTEQGFIAVTLSLVSQNEQQICFRVSVKDSGIGLSDEQKERLFAEFSQADSSTTRKFGGTGLGLWISKKLVEKMQGQIEVHSTIGEGAEFVLELTLAVSDEQSAQDDAGQIKLKKHYDWQGANILLVDDTMINRMVVAAILEPLGVNVAMAENGEEAVQKYKEGDYDLVLMDCLMPVMDGFDASRCIRAFESELEQGKHTPIVALTANALEDTKEQCMASGMDEFLTKPVIPERLIEVFEQYLK